MIKLIRFFISAAFSLVLIQFAFSSGPVTYAQSGPANIDHQVSAMKKPEKAIVEAEGSATTEENAAVISDPLVRVLISKGILNKIEGRTISASGTPSEQRDRLVT